MKIETGSEKFDMALGNAKGVPGPNPADRLQRHTDFASMMFRLAEFARFASFAEWIFSNTHFVEKCISKDIPDEC